MGTEAEARALGSGDTIEIMEDGKSKKYTLRPIVVQNLCDLERMALNDHKKSYLSTYADNTASLFKDVKDFDIYSLLREKLEEVANWDLSNLPQ